MDQILLFTLVNCYLKPGSPSLSLKYWSNFHWLFKNNEINRYSIFNSWLVLKALCLLFSDIVLFLRWLFFFNFLSLRIGFSILSISPQILLISHFLCFYNLDLMCWNILAFPPCFFYLFYSYHLFISLDFIVSYLFLFINSL